MICVLSNSPDWVANRIRILTGRSNRVSGLTTLELDCDDELDDWLLPLTLDELLSELTDELDELLVELSDESDELLVELDVELRLLRLELDVELLELELLELCELSDDGLESDDELDDELLLELLVELSDD